MTRKKKPRCVNFMPEITYFKPSGVPLSSLEEVCLTYDELEAIRLADLEGMEQIPASKKMKISQPTLQRILTETHKKIADALVKGKAIRVEGGEVIMPRPGRGAGRGGGRGRAGGPFAAGPGGVCVCTNPECKNKIPHTTSVPCFQIRCSKCGLPMIRQDKK